MSLVDHARRELELSGATTEDPALAESLVKAVEAFAAYGHSGGSAEWARTTLALLLAFEPLSPITTDPAEWIDQTEACGGGIDGKRTWQNVRNSRALSHDGGRTHYFVDDDLVAGEFPVYTTLDPEAARMVMTADAGDPVT
jgi:hypothetical protein